MTTGLRNSLTRTASHGDQSLQWQDLTFSNRHYDLPRYIECALFKRKLALQSGHGYAPVKCKQFGPNSPWTSELQQVSSAALEMQDCRKFLRIAMKRSWDDAAVRAAKRVKVQLRPGSSDYKVFLQVPFLAKTSLLTWTPRSRWQQMHVACCFGARLGICQGTS